jgi:hypothetical protein
VHIMVMRFVLQQEWHNERKVPKTSVKPWTFFCLLGNWFCKHKDAL